MFFKSKYVNIICIALVLTVLALGLTAGIFGIISLLNPDIAPVADYDTPKKKETVPVPLPPILDDNEIPYAVFGEKNSDGVYLRGDNYGDYNGKEWLEATAYTKLIDSKYPATYLSSKSIESMSGSQSQGLAIVPHNSQLVIPSYTATKHNGSAYTEKYQIPKDDLSSITATQEEMQKKAQERQYQLYYYEYNNTKIEPSGLSNEYKTYEQNYRKFVQGQYLKIDLDMEEYILNLIKEQNFDKNSADLPSRVVGYVSSLAEYSTEYDPTLDEQDNVVKSFVEEYKKGSCKHFATVATLIFRALDVPARYVTGFLTETVANEWVDVTKDDAHAWVEIYVDGFGWKTVEATPKTMSFKIKPVDVDKIYDGSPLLPEQKVEDVKDKTADGEVVASEGGFVKYLEDFGYTYEAVISGEITQPGKAESKIESIKVFDADGNDVSHMFTFQCEPGEMLVYAGTITLVSDGFDWKYNGGKIESKLELCKLRISEEEPFSQKYTFSLLKKEISSEIGYHPHDFDVQILDENGEDVAYLYKRKYELKSVFVYASELKFIAGSKDKVWDGTPLTCNEYTVEGDLMEGDTIAEGGVFVTGSITDPGSVDNIIDLSKVVINNSKGENVTSKYKLTAVHGRLTVTGDQ